MQLLVDVQEISIGYDLYLESWWKKTPIFFKVLFWALTKSHSLLRRYQPLESIENLRIICFPLLNMRTMSRFQFPRLNIYQSNCLRRCGPVFIPSPGWQLFWFTQHWKVMVSLTFFLFHSQNLGRSYFQSSLTAWESGCWKCLIFQQESCLNLNRKLYNMQYVANGCSQVFPIIVEENKTLNTMPSSANFCF